VALQRWPAGDGARRGRVLLIHGLSSIADSWWRMGPALAARGWDVVAVDQAGHGGRAVAGEVSAAALAAAVRDVHTDRPDVLIGHSLGTVTALGLLEDDPAWAGTVILEEPPSQLAPEACLTLADGIVADVDAVRTDRGAVVARVRRDCPHWDDEDVHWAVQGIAEMDPLPFARWLRRLADEAQGRDGGGQAATPERIASVAPRAHVLAALGERTLLDGGSALAAPDRDALAARLPPGHVVGIAGGHCLHRDAPDAWLAAVDAATA
jgi:pimeloyl-ACP methyl ester carboxylesterase